MSDKVSEDQFQDDLPDLSLPCAHTIARWHAEERWHAIRKIAATVIGPMSSGYASGADKRLAEDAMDLAEQLFVEGELRANQAMAIWDAANPEPVEEPGDE